MALTNVNVGSYEPFDELERFSSSVTTKNQNIKEIKSSIVLHNENCTTINDKICCFCLMNVKQLFKNKAKQYN